MEGEVKGLLGTRPGAWGAGIILALFSLGLAGPLLVPFPEAGRRWRDIAYWEDSPAAAPPAWTAWLRGAGLSSGSRRIEAEAVEEVSLGESYRRVWRFRLGASPGGETSGLALLLRGTGRLAVRAEAEDADGVRREIARKLVDAVAGQPTRLALPPARGAAIVLTEIGRGTAAPERPGLVVVGSVSGLLGTDASKRDVFTGLVLGLRWALVLGIAVGFLTVATGLALALAAACLGGWADSAINRLYEFFSSMPLLPFLIVLSAAYKPSIWSFAALALLFFWTRAFKPIYAMALRVREEGHVEAARSMGAGRWHRAVRHVLPAILPYAFSVMSLSVPGIILSEAGISLLGLGDAGAVTWGQMLHEALARGAVVDRLWWWILSPGLAISVTGLAFALLARGFERLANPGR